ncbi:MAG: hypothetical protein AAGF53_17925 [Pseudomonadota bacterium]
MTDKDSKSVVVVKSYEDVFAQLSDSRWRTEVIPKEDALDPVGTGEIFRFAAALPGGDLDTWSYIYPPNGNRALRLLGFFGRMTILARQQISERIEPKLQFHLVVFDAEIAVQEGAGAGDFSSVIVHAIYPTEESFERHRISPVLKSDAITDNPAVVSKSNRYE